MTKWIIPTIIQTIFDKLSVIFSTYGTYSIQDIYYVVFGTKYNKLDTYEENNTLINDKMEIIEKYLIPVDIKIYHGIIAQRMIL